MMAKRDGFTLVELAIVLVVIGLIVGAIVAGQNLIRIAQMRSVSAEAATYKQAAKIFKEVYGSLPGDIYNAGEHWGYASGGSTGPCTNPGLDTGSGTETCDGNGNAVIESYERLRFWQHLSNAGLVEGSFSGAEPSGGSGNTHIAGENAPRSDFPGGVWRAETWLDHGGDGTTFAGDYGNFVQIGGTAAGGGLPEQPLFTPKELFKLDSKLDDGMPATGKVRVLGRQQCTNGSSVTDFGAEYTLTSEAQDCGIFFARGF